jgi:hypothetical protein
MVGNMLIARFEPSSPTLAFIIADLGGSGKSKWQRHIGPVQ